MTELDTLAFLMLACNQSGSLDYLEYVRTKTPPPPKKILVLYTEQFWVSLEDCLPLLYRHDMLGFYWLP